MKSTAVLFKETATAWANGNSSRVGAALAYYTIFAIAPLFVIALSMSSFFFGEKAARKELFGQINGLVGSKGGEAIQSLVIAATSQPRTSYWATLGAVVTLGAGATAVFVELQDALNNIWGVQRKPGGGLRHFIVDRLLSFAMMLGIGFLLLVALVLNAALAGVGHFATGFLQGEKFWLSPLNFLVSLGVITLLFAMIFKLLPDVAINWKDVWLGAFVTGLLFNFGKFLIGYYLGRSSTLSIYGAAGSLVIVLVWVYYSAQIVFFGAHFTHIHAGKRAARHHFKSSLEPDEGKLAAGA
ncbi:MAG TPA: YihY/virulence factor BrkB family protein [Verrucomicrobiae bacterium]